MFLALLFAYLGVEGGFYEMFFGYHPAQEPSVIPTLAAVPQTEQSPTPQTEQSPTPQAKQRKEQWCDKFLSDPTPVQMKFANPIDEFPGVREIIPVSGKELGKFDCRLRDFLLRQFEEMPDSHSMTFDLDAMDDRDGFFAPPFPEWNPWGEKPSEYSLRTEWSVGAEAYQKAHIRVMSPSYCAEGLDSSWEGNIKILYTCTYFYLRVEGYDDKTFTSIPLGDLPQMSLDSWRDIFGITSYIITG